MSNLKVLPDNWKEKATLCSKGEAKKWRQLFPGVVSKGGGVVVDDDCPLSAQAIVIGADSKVYRITDQKTDIEVRMRMLGLR